jgi:hypothetical protein
MVSIYNAGAPIHHVGVARLKAYSPRLHHGLNLSVFPAHITNNALWKLYTHQPIMFVAGEAICSKICPSITNHMHKPMAEMSLVLIFCCNIQIPFVVVHM